MKIRDFLELDEPERYDLKDEKGYIGKGVVKACEYVDAKDKFDCDGTGEGDPNSTCKLIREIYRILWNWQDLRPNSDRINRYGKSIYKKCDEMGPETMCSFKTTYNAKPIRAEVKSEKKLKEYLDRYAEITGRIGNMTLTAKGNNKYIAYDYWDIKIYRQYLTNDNNMSFVNMFFQWDFVRKEDDKYAMKLYYEGHDKAYYPKTKENIQTYIDIVDVYTKRRGLFMATMIKFAIYDKYKNLHINEKYSVLDRWKVNDLYKFFVKEVFQKEKAYAGYEEVFDELIKVTEKLKTNGDLSGEIESVVGELNDLRDKILNLR